MIQIGDLQSIASESKRGTLRPLQDSTPNPAPTRRLTKYIDSYVALRNAETRCTNSGTMTTVGSQGRQNFFRVTTQLRICHQKCPSYSQNTNGGGARDLAPTPTAVNIRPLFEDSRSTLLQADKAL